MNLSKYNSTYHPGRSLFICACWYLVNSIIFRSSLFPIYSLKRFLLRLFGAHIGKGVIIKPRVNIKYPWHLSIGDYSWIGEEVWIDNLSKVTIGANCCISQGALLLCGNHDYKKETFDLIALPIILEDQVWIAARSVVCAGVTCGKSSVLTVGSVATHDLEPGMICQGNPAVVVHVR
jgi:putative colanic acid biosynthesis acetyltransferase WcaF